MTWGGQVFCDTVSVVFWFLVPLGLGALCVTVGYHAGIGIMMDWMMKDPEYSLRILEIELAKRGHIVARVIQ